jgi:hypothetical protein
LFWSASLFPDFPQPPECDGRLPQTSRHPDGKIPAGYEFREQVNQARGGRAGGGGARLANRASLRMARRCPTTTTRATAAAIEGKH